MESSARWAASAGITSLRALLRARDDAPMRTLSMLALVVVGCGSGAEHTTVPDPSGAASTSGSTATSAASAGVPGSAPKMPARKPLEVVVQTDENLRLLPVEGALFVAGNSILTRVDGDKLVRDERLGKIGLNWGYVVDLVGKWPDDLRALALDSDGRVGWGTMFAWTQDHWSPTGTPL